MPPTHPILAVLVQDPVISAATPCRNGRSGCVLAAWDTYWPPLPRRSDSSGSLCSHFGNAGDGDCPRPTRFWPFRSKIQSFRLPLLAEVAVLAAFWQLGLPLPRRSDSSGSFCSHFGNAGDADCPPPAPFWPFRSKIQPFRLPLLAEIAVLAVFWQLGRPMAPPCHAALTVLARSAAISATLGMPMAPNPLCFGHLRPKSNHFGCVSATWGTCSSPP